MSDTVHTETRNGYKIKIMRETERRNGRKGKDENTMLECEKNTSAVERKIRAAFIAEFNRPVFCTVFEHGSWFIILKAADWEDEDRIFSVCDSAPRGFCFDEL